MIVAIVQARVSSTRLPGKVLKPLMGKPMLLRQLERVARAKSLDKIVVATSVDASDEPLRQLCHESNIPVYAGSLNDVLDRYYQAAKASGATKVVRITGDCPLIDPGLIDEVVSFFNNGDFDYASNTIKPSFPDGLDTEIMTMAALEKAWREAARSTEREHVTYYMYTHPEIFKTGSLVGERDYSNMRWTVDEPADFSFVSRIYATLYLANPEFTWNDVLAYIAKNPQVAEVNNQFSRNEGLQKSLSNDHIVR